MLPSAGSLSSTIWATVECNGNLIVDTVHALRVLKPGHSPVRDISPAHPNNSRGTSGTALAYSAVTPSY
jgi:hypothetical protein